MKKLEPVGNLERKKIPIKLFVMDIDGTLTDGGVYYSIHGEETIKFNRKDGVGIAYLKESKILTMFLSGEENGCSARRAEKLEIDYCILGALNKKERLENFLFTNRIDWKEVAYIGDDVNDFECLCKVGLPGCPSDAADSIKEIKNVYICQCTGGHGAVREFAEYCVSVNQSLTQKPGTVHGWRV